MERVNRILKHPKFIAYLALNEAAEDTRRFCHHDLQHAVDVARVAYIISLEKGYALNKEVIYMAALLHDIAKWKQYQSNMDHASEGAVLAAEILQDIGIDEGETEFILEAIRSHRSGAANSPLGEIIYEGDKVCRLCSHCKALHECNRFDQGQTPLFRY